MWNQEAGAGRRLFSFRAGATVAQGVDGCHPGWGAVPGSGIDGFQMEAVGIEVQAVGQRQRIEHCGVVTDDDECARPATQQRDQRIDAVEIEMAGRAHSLSSVTTRQCSMRWR